MADEDTPMEKEEPVDNAEQDSGNSQLKKVASKGGKSEMLSAKRDRQRAEQDVQLLMNRLKHLKMEEERARRKIDETNARASEISTLKKRNEDDQKEQLRIHQEKELGRTGGAASNHQMAIETRKNRIASEKRMKDDKTRSAREMKNNRKANENAIRQQKNAFKGANSAMKEQIRARKAQVAAQRAAEKKAHEDHLENLRLQRLHDEKQKRALAEEMIHEMEKEEERLIDKLRATQDRQRQAYEGLEKALQS